MRAVHSRASKEFINATNHETSPLALVISSYSGVADSEVKSSITVLVRRNAAIKDKLSSLIRHNFMNALEQTKLGSE